MDQQNQDVQTSPKSYITNTSVNNVGRFIPPGHSQSDSEDAGNQTVFLSNTQQKSVSTGISTDQESDPAPDTALRRNTQVGGT